MLSRRVRIQLAVFVVLGLLSTTVAAIYYARLPRLLGFGQYRVTAFFSDASGLYTHALVDQNGVDVGLVQSISLTQGGAKVVLSIDNGRKVPDDARAEIHSTSAIGEQYVDLVSDRDTGPYLKGGSTVPISRTSILPSSGALLDSVDNFLKALPDGQLARVLNEVDTAFSGTGDDLRSLVESSSSLVQTASANLAPTIRLLQVAQPFLARQLALSSTTTTTVTNLRSFTDQLVSSNSDIASLMANTGAFTDQVNGLTSDLNPTLPILLDNLTTVGGVLQTYLPATRQTLVLYPAVVAQFQSVLLPETSVPGAVLDFKANVNNPPVCNTGFIPSSQQRIPADVTETTTPKGIYCKIAPTDPRVVRGARNTPCLQYPGLRAATPTICDSKAGKQSTINAPTSDQLSTAALNGDSATTGYVPANPNFEPPGTANPKDGSASSTVASTTPTAAAPYETTTGRFQAPDGTFYVLGAGATGSANVPKTWQKLLMSLVGEMTVQTKIDTESDDVTDTDADADADTDSESDEERSRRRVSRGAVLRSAAVTVVAALVVLGVLLVVALGGQSDAKSRAEKVARNSGTLSVLEQGGLVAARAEVVKLTTLSQKTAKAQLASLLADASGGFRSNLAQISSQLTSAVIQAKVTTVGKIDESGVVTSNAKTKSVTSLVAAEQHVSNSSVPKGETRNYRLTVTMQQVKGKWMVTNMGFVP